jgi:hypothetical protein
MPCGPVELHEIDLPPEGHLDFDVPTLDSAPLCRQAKYVVPLGLAVAIATDPATRAPDSNEMTDTIEATLRDTTRAVAGPRPWLSE